MSHKEPLFFRGSVFFSWLFSYISVLMIPIIISGFVYIEAASIVEKEINRADGALLKQLQQAIDTQMADIQKISLRTALSSNTVSLMYTKDGSTDLYHYVAGKLNEELGLYKLSNDLIDNFYIYFKNTDYILSNETFAKADLYYDTYISPETAGFEQWKIFHNNIHAREFVKVPKINNNGRDAKAIAYAQSIPMVEVKEPLGTIVIQLNEAKLLDTIRNVKWDKRGEVFILDGNNTVVATTQTSGLSLSIKYEELKGASGVAERDLNGEKMAVSYIKSDFSDLNWKYVSVIPAKIFSERAEHIRKTVYISVFLCLVIGGLLAFFFTRKNYNPMNDLVKALAAKAGIPFGKRLNEYKFIQEAISSAINEKEEIKDRLKRQDLLLRSNFLTRLLKGRVENSLPLDEALTSLDIHFNSEHFAVILFYIEDYSELFKDECNFGSEEQLKLVQFILANIVEELAERKHKGIVTEIDDVTACLVNLNADNLSDLGNELKKIANEAMTLFRDTFKIHVTVSISNIHHTAAEISKAYEEALDAMEYKMVLGGGKIIVYENIVNHTANDFSYGYSLELEQRLINSIKVGDFSKSRSILYEIFDKNLCPGTVSIDIAKCLMFDLVSTFIKALDGMEMPGEEFFVKKFNPLEELLSCKTVNKMKEKMTGILLKVCEQTEVKKKSHNTQLRDRVLQIIEENYKDENLSITAIADSFGLNLAYLSRFFKEQTGEGLLDYINRYRLEKAKQLLKAAEANIGDVARAVGFYNSSALIRIFKKYEGITPGQYKEIAYATRDAGTGT